MLLVLIAGCIPLEPSGGPLDTAADYGTCAEDWDGDGESWLDGDCRPYEASSKEVCNGVDDNCDGKADDGATGCYLPAKGASGSVGHGNVWWKMGFTTCDQDFGGAWLSWGFDSSDGNTGCTVFAALKRQGEMPDRPCPGCLWAFSMVPENAKLTGELCDANDITASALDSVNAKWGFDGEAMLAYADGDWFEFARTDSATAHVEGDENYAYVDLTGSATTFRYETF